MFVKTLDTGPVAVTYVRNKRQLCMEIEVCAVEWKKKSGSRSVHVARRNGSMYCFIFGRLLQIAIWPTKPPRQPELSCLWLHGRTSHLLGSRGLSSCRSDDGPSSSSSSPAPIISISSSQPLAIKTTWSRLIFRVRPPFLGPLAAGD